MRWLVCLMLACAAKTGAPPPTARVAHTEQPVTPKPRADGPSEAECDALLTHALAIIITQRTVATRAQPPTEADKTALRTELRPAFVADCRAGTREYHACGLAAKSASDFEACK